MAQGLRVLSFNLNILPWGSIVSTGDHAHPDKRLDQFFQQLATLQSKGCGYDVVLLQEVFSTPHIPLLCKQARVIARMRKLGFTHVVRGTQPSIFSLKWTDSGLLIFAKSKFSILDEGAIAFSVASSYDEGASKGVLFVKLKIGDASLLVFNCHLQASHGTSRGRYHEIRMEQLRSLRRFIAEKTHAHPTDPWLLGTNLFFFLLFFSVSRFFQFFLLPLFLSLSSISSFFLFS